MSNQQCQSTEGSNLVYYIVTLYYNVEFVELLQFWSVPFIKFCVADCRYNLDPEGRRSDDEVWEALDIVNMKNTIKFMSGQLGSLFSTVNYYCNVVEVSLHFANASFATEFSQMMA